MTEDQCGVMRLLLQADVDGELSPAEAARVGAHLETCAACRQIQGDLLDLTARLKAELPRHQASDALRAAVRARLAERDAADARRQWFGAKRFLSPASLPAFGGGFALAACLAAFLLVPVALMPRADAPDAETASDAVVSSHIRALQPGHLMDVASSDQHTVKPWFDGRLPFAPPVKDLSQVGFPLIGGRLDYVGRHTAAALIYRHGAHDINLFVWPARATAVSIATGTRDGYHFETWAQDGMVFWVVSDLNAKDLADFVERWRAT